MSKGKGLVADRWRDRAMPKDGVCPNGCGEVLVLDNPIHVFIDETAYEFMIPALKGDAENRVVHCKVIRIVCPACSWTLSQTYTKTEWIEHLDDLRERLIEKREPLQPPKRRSRAYKGDIRGFE